jgi:disulfide oxidoreductase YuzD
MRVYDRDFFSLSNLTSPSTKSTESSIRSALKDFRITRVNVNPGMKPTYVGIWWHPKAQSWRELRNKIDVDTCMIAVLVRDACTVPFRLEMAAVYPMERNGEPIKVFQAEIDRSGASKIVKSKLPERSSDYIDLFKERWYVPELR